MLVLLVGGPFDGRDYEVQTNFKSTLHITDPEKPPMHPDPRIEQQTSYRYRPTPRTAETGQVIYEFVGSPAA